MDEEKKTKYIMEIKTLPKAKPVPKEKLEEIKGGIGKKMLGKMKKECVKCPILEKDVTFVECFICKNFLRRIKGKIECAGDPL